MDANQEKLHHEVKELLKIKKDENNALRKIILAMERKEAKQNKPKKQTST